MISNRNQINYNIDITSDIQIIIDYCFGFAKYMLIENKEFYPFGAKVNNESNLIPIGYKDEETDLPESQKVIHELVKNFKHDMKNNNIRAYGVAYDIKILINDSYNKSDAILIDIVHKDIVEINQYCFPYEWNEKDELIFSSSFVLNQ